MDKAVGEAAGSLKSRGNAAFKDGAWASAVACYSQALDARVDTAEHAIILSNRAAAQLKLGEFQAAMNDADAALEIDPANVKAGYRKALALEGLGQGAAAVAAARAALASVTPGANSALEELAAQLALHAGPHRLPITAAMLPPALAAARWRYLPPPDTITENLLVLLHGLGDTCDPYYRFASTMSLPQTAALALSGPQAVPFTDGGRSWFTFFEASCEPIEPVPGETRRIKSLQDTVKMLKVALDSVAARAGWSRRRIHLFGFSQGGAVALELARVCTAAENPVGSVVAVCSGLLTETLREIESGSGNTRKDRRAANFSTPVLLLHGDRDELVSTARVGATEAVLRGEGLAVTRCCIPGKRHAMVSGPVESRALMEFYAQHLSQRPPGEDVVEVGGASGSGVQVELATDAE